jgi:hypothetical protein
MSEWAKFTGTHRVPSIFPGRKKALSFFKEKKISAPSFFKAKKTFRPIILLRQKNSPPHHF